MVYFQATDIGIIRLNYNFKEEVISKAPWPSNVGRKKITFLVDISGLKAIMQAQEDVSIRVKTALHGDVA